MAKVTITLPDSDEPVETQLVQLLGGLRVLPSGTAGSREITLTGERECLVAAIFLAWGPDWARAHEICQGIVDGAGAGQS
jgi:hypothetical protein